MATITKLEPHRTMYLRGFDRRGAAASMNNASATGFTVSGCWSDQADFAVAVLFDADDVYGHLFTSRYLPDFSLAGVTLDFDLVLTGCMNPFQAATLYQSVPWGSLSYITRSVSSGGVVTETPGTISLLPYMTLYTLATPPYLHAHLDFSALGLANVRQLWLTFAPALNYVAQPSGSPLHNPSLEAYVPSEWSAVFSNWTVGDTGGVTPLKIAGPGSVTVASSDTWAVRAGSGWAQVPGWYVGGFAWQSGYFGDTVTVKYSCQSTHDLYLGTALSTAGGSFIANVDGGVAVHVSTYSTQSSGSPTAGRRLIAAGVAAGSHTVVLTVAIGTCLFDFLQAAVRSDPVAPAVSYPGVSCACDFDTGQTYQIPPARLLWILSQAGFSGDIDFYAGVFFALKRVRNGGNFHAATLTISGPVSGDSWTVTVGGTALSFTVVPGDNADSVAAKFVDAINQTFVAVGAALTGSAGQFEIFTLSPINGFTLSAAAGAHGSISTVGDIGTGSEGTWAVDATQASPLNRAFVDYLTDLAGLVKAAGQSMTVAFSQELLAPPDSNDAAPTTVTFGFWNYLGTGFNHTITIGSRTYSHIQLSTDGSGDIATALAAAINAGAGDPMARATASANNVILTPRCGGSTLCTAAPDGNGPGTLKSGAWTQRFSDGTSVLTSTGFGSWGGGVIEYLVGDASHIHWTGHGFITGNTIHLANSAGGGGVWTITVTDADNFVLTTQVSNTGGYTPAQGDGGFIELQTSQCNFNPATVTAYLTACYLQAAAILNAAGLTPWLQFGEVGWWFFSRVMNESVGYASWTAPISLGTAAPHGLGSGQTAIVAAVKGTTAANGTFPITVTDSTHFTETGSAGNAAYAGGGTVSGGGMAYYDAYTAAAAVTALGRALASFWTQDDDPSVNSHADAHFLRTQLYTHMHAISAAVKTAYSGAKFEWLLPMDVNNPAVYWNAGYPYPQGGRLNNYINIPSQYMTPNGDIDRVKLEALSWGASYLNIDLAKAAMAYGSSVMSYAKTATAYLIPWFNGACAWTAQYLAAQNGGTPLICFWAFDHLCLLSWPLPLPVNKRRARVA